MKRNPTNCASTTTPDDSSASAAERWPGLAAVDGREDDRGEEEAHAVCDGAHGDEERRGERAHAPAEALLEELVDGHELAADVRRDEEKRDDDPPDEVAEDELQEG